MMTLFGIGILVLAGAGLVAVTIYFWHGQGDGRE